MNKLRLLPIISMILLTFCFMEAKAQDIKSVKVKASKTEVKSDTVSVEKKQKKQEKKKQHQKKQQKGDTFTIGVSPEKKVKAEQAQ